MGSLVMEEKSYSRAEEQLARFAKAMGHPARIAILRFLAERDECFFGDIHQVLVPGAVPRHVEVCAASGSALPV